MPCGKLRNNFKKKIRKSDYDQGIMGANCEKSFMLILGICIFIMLLGKSWSIFCVLYPKMQHMCPIAKTPPKKQHDFPDDPIFNFIGEEIW